MLFDYFTTLMSFVDPVPTLMEEVEASHLKWLYIYKKK